MLTIACCNISNIENTFVHSLLLSNLETTISDTNLLMNDDLKIEKKNKSLIAGMLSSFIIPGSGQAYMGKWKRGLIFLGIDGLALFAKNFNEKKAQDKRDSYELHAKDHWDLARWIHDYYAWESFNTPSWFDGTVDSWNEVRGVFINDTDEGVGCDEEPYCYPDIWDHSHSVKFTYDDEIISSSSENKFKPIYMELCDISSDLNQSYHTQSRECNVDVADISAALDVADAKLILDHHFYEGIQKYSMYFAGWDDALDAAVVSETNNNNSLITSPQQNSYQDEWSAYNEFKIRSERVGSYMIINHFVSMIDILILSKMSKSKYLMNLDLYPDLKNRSGIGGIKLTLNWK